MVSRLNGCCDIELFLQKLCSVTPGPGTRSSQSLSFIQVFLDCSYVHFYSQGQIQRRDRTSLYEAPMGVFSVIVLCFLFCFVSFVLLCFAGGESCWDWNTGSRRSLNGIQLQPGKGGLPLQTSQKSQPCLSLRLCELCPIFLPPNLWNLFISLQSQEQKNKVLCSFLEKAWNG